MFKLTYTTKKMKWNETKFSTKTNVNAYLKKRTNGKIKRDVSYVVWHAKSARCDEGKSNFEPRQLGDGASV